MSSEVEHPVFSTGTREADPAAPSVPQVEEVRVKLHVSLKRYEGHIKQEGPHAKAC